MKLRRQSVDLRSFLGTEIPLGELSPDLRQRVRHALAGHGDLGALTATVVRELLDRQVLRPAGTIREGRERITVYALPGSRRILDLRRLLGVDTEGRTLEAAAGAEDSDPTASADTAVEAPLEPPRPQQSQAAPPIETGQRESLPDRRAQVVPLDAIRRTLERDWVSYGLEASLEGLLEQLTQGLGDPGLELWLWADRLGLGVGEGRGWRVLQEDAGEGIALRRLLEGERLAGKQEEILHHDGRAWAAVRVAEEVVGVVGVEPETPRQGLRTAARTVEALLLAYRRSQQRVYTDSLTGLNNRSFFETQLAVELERARRTGQPLAMLFVDVDHFKRVNDTEGHEAGDLVLQHIARSMVQHLRRIDQVFRWGGEEFALLLPGTRRDEALHTADRLRSVIERTPAVLPGGRRIAVTVSIGIALAPEHAEGGERELLRHADQALYRAKADGRNRVVVYDPDLR